MDSLRKESIPPVETLLLIVMISFLLIIYDVMWYGDAALWPTWLAFLVIWLVSFPILLVFTVWNYFRSRRYGVSFPFGRYPRSFNLGYSAALGLGAAWVLIIFSGYMQRAGLGFLDIPGLAEQFGNLVKAFLPKVLISPIHLTAISGLVAIGWEAIVSGVEEVFKLGFTIALSVIMYYFVKSYKVRAAKKDPMKDVEPSLFARGVCLSVSVFSVGLMWDLMHGFHSYTKLSEFACAGLALVLMSVMTFVTGSPLPAFFCHWWFNVLAPAVATSGGSLIGIVFQVVSGSSAISLEGIFMLMYLVALMLFLVCLILLVKRFRRRRGREDS